jgi:methionyl-tRNA formyltransferase
MKIILFAHQNWGVETIRTILQTQHEIVQVFTHPLDMDKNEKIWYDSVKDECELHQISVKQRIKLTNEDISEINNLSPDLILSVGWRRLIPNSIFQIPKFGTINMHEALLPQYRGFAPINWVLINGENSTGITLHYIDETADTGDILLQKSVIISKNDTAYSLFNKLLKLVSSMILDLLKKIDEKSLSPIPQKRTDGFFASRRFPQDGQIDWKLSSETIYNLIRALSDPYPNAFCYYQNKKILIKSAELDNDDYRGLPGSICAIKNNKIIVTCGTNHKENQAIILSNFSFENNEPIPSNFFKLWSQLK